jgi:hypothetical protein
VQSQTHTHPFRRICNPPSANSGFEIRKPTLGDYKSPRTEVLGISQGSSIFAIAEFIGKDETIKRIDTLLNTVPAK